VLSEPPPPAPVSHGNEGIPSSLEDAVMREISERSPEVASGHFSASDAPPIIEPSALRKRSSNPPADRDAREPSEDRVQLPSLPPDAMVPATGSGEEAAAAPAPGFSPLASMPPEPPPPAEAEVEFHVEEVFTAPLAPPTEPPATQPLALLSTAPPTRPARPEPTLRIAAPPVPSPAALRPTQATKRQVWPIVLALALLGIAIGAFLHLKGNDAPQPGPTPSTKPPTTAPSALPPAPSTVATGAPSANDDAPSVADVPEGFGVIEVSAPAGARVRIDGAIAGTGPSTTLVAAPGYHEVRVEQDAGATKQVVEVRSGKTTRVTSATAP
jgi:hypothetical protein